MNQSRSRIMRSAVRMLGIPALLAGLVPSLAFSQAAPVTRSEESKPGSGPQVVPTVERAPAKTALDEVVELSPFQVTTSNKGYFASNTMSGTRLNSSIEDLGQSITVMTKDQMTDFAMLNINDVFDYMASTEGTGSFSDFVVDRTGDVSDNVSLNPNTANRVRGIGSANIAFDNVAITGRVPIDPLWIDSLELSRGPNANIFGLGNSSGTVNQVPAMANFSRDFSRTEVRADSYDGYRGSIDANRVLVKGKLAVRASLAHQHTGFVRKPSGEDARLLSLQVKAQPFKGTTVSFGYYGYDNKAQRPNFTTPRDYISGWYAAGKPSWDPVTRLITVNGTSYGQGMVAGSTTPITTLPSYFAAADARARFLIGKDGESYWTTPTVTSTTTPLTGVSNSIRYVLTAPVITYTNQPLFATTPALADKSIYDWEHINLISANMARDNVKMYLAQLDQVFVHNTTHTLAGQFTHLREDAQRWENLPLGPASVNGVNGQIYVDPNTRNLDGSVNPFFGRPYLRSSEPFFKEMPMLWQTTRTQLAYNLDLTHEKGWMKWLGSHQFLGYHEFKNEQRRQYSYRHTASSTNTDWEKNLVAQGIPLANRTTSNSRYGIAPGNTGRMFEQYYIGSTPGGGVEYGSNPFPEGSVLPFVWGNTGAFHYDPTQVSFTPSPDGSGGLASEQLHIKTLGGVYQTNLFKNRLIATFGLREDKVFSRNAPFAYLSSDLKSFDYAQSDAWLPSWRLAKGKTKSEAFVLRPLRDLGFLKSGAENGSGIGKVLCEALGSLSLTYNNSDNFIPLGPAVDLFLRPLPNQTGASKDAGLWMTMFDGKLSVRYNHYRTDQINYRNGDINTIAQRVLRADGLNATDAWNLQDRATDWVTQLHPTWSVSQIKAEVAKTMGLSQETIDGLESAIAAGTLAATQDIVSRGDELEVNYNPTPHWTINASATKMNSVNQNAGSTVEEWIATRMPIWTTVEDPRFPDPSRPGHSLLWRNIAGATYKSYGYDATNSAATNYTTFVEGPLAVFRQLEGKSRPQIRKYTGKFNTRYQLAGLTQNRILRNVAVGGSLRWSDKGAIGYYGMDYNSWKDLPLAQRPKIMALDPYNPVYAKAETYIDLFVSYSTKLYHDRVRARFQLNVKNVQENGGGLQPTGAFPDGTPLSYRIVDPRQFILSASFDL